MHKANARHFQQDARMVMHDDEHAILKEILRKALGDDGSFRRLVSSDPSASARVEDRLVLARFLDRMERQFALRLGGRAAARDRDRDGRAASASTAGGGASALNGGSP